MDLRKLKIGNHYYILGYYDKELKVPLVQTLIFSGTDVMNIEGRGKVKVWCFKKPSGTVGQGPVGDKSQGHEYSANYCIAEDELGSLLTLEDLINDLQKLQVRIEGVSGRSPDGNPE